jgi:hypothetical protein
MSTNTIGTVQNTNVRGNSIDSTLDTDTSGSTQATSIASGKSTSTSNPNSAQDASDKAMARKYMADAIQTTIAEQPVQQSGFCGLQNNSADISKSKASATSQLSDIADQFVNSGITGTEALQIASQFISQVKAAGGKALSSSQMLSLQQLVSSAARNDDVGAAAVDTTAATPVTAPANTRTQTPSTTATDCGFSKPSTSPADDANEAIDSSRRTGVRTRATSDVTTDVTNETEQMA